MIKRRSPFTVIFSLVLTAFLPCMASAASPEKAQKESCVTDKCHSRMGKDAFVHGPAAVGDCNICHIPKPKEKHKFEPIRRIGDVCYQCHDKVDTKKVLHKPVKDGNCGLCHDSHQSAYRYQLRADGSNLCFQCHDKKLISGKFMHAPVAAGGCSQCHNPHGADFPKLLNAPGNEACYQCHSDKAEAFKNKKYVHMPVQDKCVNCHNPHSGDYKFNFSAEGSQELCFTCHADKKEWIGKVKVTHGGLATDRKCLACHDPHVSDFVKQLVKEPVDSCMMCHDKALNSPGKKVAEMKAFLAQNKIHHGPISQGDCSGCHNTHGSDNYRMLRQYFPPVFYAPFDPKNYELCFGCHEKTLVLEARTKTLTGFRNGEQNLHFVHVNKEIKGRTCIACHNAHATNNPKHIRDTVPFGAWGLPVGFTNNENGGACLPGCHQRFGYDRVKAVKNR